MAKRKRTTILHIKLKIVQHKSHQNRGWTQVLWTGRQFLLHKLHRRVTLVINSVISHEWFWLIYKYIVSSNMFVPVVYLKYSL
jgi:hypothetical protein